MNTEKIKIAITDDHAILLASMVYLIKGLDNCKVILEAQNGSELLTLLSVANELPDIYILDINMPILNGYDTLVELKKLYPDVKVIALTGFNTEYAIIRMIQNGANAYLPKTCSGNVVHEAINTLTKEEFYYSDIAPKKMFEKAKSTVLPQFSKRELLFLDLCCKGQSFADIARHMYVSVRTVENYFNSISSKTQIKDKTGLISFAKDSGLVYSSHH